MPRLLADSAEELVQHPTDPATDAFFRGFTHATVLEVLVLHDATGNVVAHYREYWRRNWGATGYWHGLLLGAAGGEHC